MSFHSQDIGDKFTSSLAIGSDSGGEDFSLLGSVKKYVEEITFYLVDDKYTDPTVKKSIGQITVKKFDGSCITIGTVKTKTRCTLTLRPSEKLTRIRLWSHEDRLAGVELTTSKSQHLRVCIPGLPPSTQPTDIPVGSGHLVGVFGRSGMYVDSLGFAVLK